MSKRKQFWNKNGEAIKVITFILAATAPVLGICLVTYHHYDKMANEIITDLNNETITILENKA